jgi:hypothetical protein
MPWKSAVWIFNDKRLKNRLSGTDSAGAGESAQGALYGQFSSGSTREQVSIKRSAGEQREVNSKKAHLTSLMKPSGCQPKGLKVPKKVHNIGPSFDINEHQWAMQA